MMNKCKKIYSANSDFKKNRFLSVLHTNKLMHLREHTICQNMHTNEYFICFFKKKFKNKQCYNCSNYGQMSILFFSRLFENLFIKF